MRQRKFPAKCKSEKMENANKRKKKAFLVPMQISCGREEKWIWLH